MTPVRLSALALLAGVLPAAAADLPTRKQPAPPPLPVVTPLDSGFYVGAFAGGTFGGLTTSPGAGGNGAAFTTGTLIGYKWKVSPITFGLEGDITSNWLTQKFGSAGGFPATQVDSVYALHARGRIGYQIGNFEPFIAGGFAMTQLVQQRQAPAEFIGASSLRPGWTIGAGVDGNFDVPVFGPTTIRAEYLYDKITSTNMNLGGVIYNTGGSEQYARVALIKYLNPNPLPPTPPMTVDWSGNYVGVLGAYNWAQISTGGFNFNANGGSIGIYTGRNWMFGTGGMLGYEGSTSFSNVTGNGPQPLAANTHFKDYMISDIRGRAGWAFGRWLPYAAAGVAFDTSAQTNLANGNYRGDIFQTSATVGAGVEYMLTDRLAARGEYTYSRSVGTVTTKLDAQNCCSQKREAQSFRLGLGYFLR